MTTIDATATRSIGRDERVVCTATVRQRDALVPPASCIASATPKRMVEPRWERIPLRRTIVDLVHIMERTYSDDPVEMLNDEMRDELPFLVTLTVKHRIRIYLLLQELAIDQYSDHHCIYAFQRTRVRLGQRQWYLGKLLLKLCCDGGDDDYTFDPRCKITCACSAPASLFDAHGQPVPVRLHDAQTHPNMHACVNPHHMYVLPARSRRRPLPPRQPLAPTAQQPPPAKRKRARMPTSGVLCDALLFEYVLMQAQITGKRRQCDPMQVVGRLKRRIPLFVQHLRLRPPPPPITVPLLYAARPPTLEAAYTLRQRLFGD